MEHEVDSSGGKENNLLDLVIIFLKRFRLIAAITIGVALCTVIISLTMPRIYESTARILPPGRSENSTAALLSRVTGNMGFGDLFSGGVAGSPDLYMGIMKGRTVLDAVIDRLQLMDRYKTSKREVARKRLSGAVRLAADKRSGIVSISVADKDPQRAMELTNAFAEELSNRLQTLAVTSATKKRLFFEEQLKLSHTALANAEDAISSFQGSTGVIKMDDQAKAGLAGISRLQASVAAKEIELKVMKTYATPQNQDFRRVEEELRGLHEQLKKMEGGGYASNSIIPTEQLPLLGTEYVRKLREFKYQEALYEILLKQYEAARLAEAQDAAMVQIVDAATVPEFPVRPKRKLMVLLATMVSFLLATFLAFTIEHVSKTFRSPEDLEKIARIKKYLGKLIVNRYFSRLRIGKLFDRGAV